MRKIVGLVLGVFLVASACPAYGGKPGKGEVTVLQPGQWAPARPSDEHVVPGVAGTWTPARTQTQIRDDILAQERSRAPECVSPRIANTLIAATDVVQKEGGKFIAQWALESWLVDRCGEIVPYYVTRIFGPRKGEEAYKAVPAEAFSDYAGDHVALLKLKELAEQREAQRAAGEWEALNVPFPPIWKVAFWRRDEATHTVIFEMLPENESLADWRSMRTVQLLSGESRPTPEELLNGARELRRELCGSEQAPAAMEEGAAVRNGTVPLVCERVPRTDLAEVTLAKAIAGRRYVYYVHLGWRTAAGDRASVLEALKEQIAAGWQWLEQVHVCDTVRDPSGCESPFFL